MTLNEEQYERAELTDSQREQAEQIRRDEAALAGMLDCETPRAAIDRARRRMLAELARPGRRRAVRIGAVAAAAAAAAIVLVVTLFPARGPDTTLPLATDPDLPGLSIDTLIAEALKTGSADLDLLASQIDALEADIMLAASPALPETAPDLDELENEIDEFWIDQSLRELLEG